MSKDNDNSNTDSLGQLLNRAEQATPATSEEPQRNGTDAGKTEEGKDKAKAEASENDYKKSLRHSIWELTRDESEDEKTNLSFKSFIGGDFLNAKVFRRQAGYIFFIFVLLFIYVGNRYACQNAELKQKELNDTLNDRKFKAITVASQLTEETMRKSIEESLPDTTLKTSTKASYYLTE